MDTPIVTGSFAVIAGNVMGTLIDKSMEVFDERFKMTNVLSSIGPEKASLLDSILGVFIHVGIIGIGCELLARATPWIFEDPAGFSLFMMTLWATSPHLEKHVKQVNTILFTTKTETETKME